MTTVRLNPVYLGQAGELAIYRVDLSQSGLATIGTITIHDDNVLSGGSGSVSGLDLDFVKLVGKPTVSASEVLSLAGDRVFDFGSAGVVFEAGYQTPLWPGDPPTLNTNLQGTSGANIYDPTKTTLGTADSKELSFGESGSLTFLLGSGLTTDGRYFYFGEAGGNSEGAYVSVSSGITAEPTDFTLVGTPGNDTFTLGAGLNAHLMFTNTTVYGRGGHDTVYGALGNDRLYGEAGRDLLFGGAGNDSLYGGNDEDRIHGGAGDDWLYGGARNDRISGSSGSDRIFGGSGHDKLFGGDGRDVFVFDTRPSKSSNVDRVYDFNPKHDSFHLENAVFTKLGSGSVTRPKKVTADMFVKGRAAQDQEDRIIYDKNTGALYYDKDGTGGSSQVKFATLNKGLKVTYHDFFVI
jgi:Ca2+-binding RTX toxin-like protein